MKNRKEIIEQALASNKDEILLARTVLKFGGTSLFGQDNLERFLHIIQSNYQIGSIAIVVSARGASTDHLTALFDLAKKAEDYTVEFKAFVSYLEQDQFLISPKEDIHELNSVLSAISLLRDDSEFAYDRVIAFGELLSAKSITHWLKEKGIKTKFMDARSLIFTRQVLGEFEVDMEKSRMVSRAAIQLVKANEVPIITGFIATSEEDKTVTLGRNGSNYTATLIASFIQAKEVQNWTDVDGVYTANPSIVSNAKKIDKLTYKEANELANFGMDLLHPKTILPLMQAQIPLRIMNIRNPEMEGTTIQQHVEGKGIKAVTTIKNVSLVTIEGNGLSQKIGIDARIFSSLGNAKISVKMISQAASERGIGFVLSSDEAASAEAILNTEFADEIRLGEISNVQLNHKVGIIAILGRHNFALEKAIAVLRKNEIWMHLISNSITGEHISLVVDLLHLDTAVRLVHNEVFRILKIVHVFAFGKGQVGAEFISQVLGTKNNIIEERGVHVKIIGVADSTSYIIDPKGLGVDWRNKLTNSNQRKSIVDIVKALKSLSLNDIVIVDNTSSETISKHYPYFAEHNMHIVASNKKFNSGNIQSYLNLKKKLRQIGNCYYYEANVGAGLPIMSTLSALYNSSDIITKIKGVFSGSLSYIFNNFSIGHRGFSEVLMKALDLGYAEPDPREDLNGLDVARKLVILAREINYHANLEDVKIENLIPASLRNLGSKEEFLSKTMELDAHFTARKDKLSSDSVLRYVAELDVVSKVLQVSLVEIPLHSPLGQVKNADTLFEIYTESYQDQPIIIQGAGAGPKVTARAVYSDVLKIKS